MSYTNIFDSVGSFDIRFSAMASPMVPRPMKPTDAGLLSIVSDDFLRKLVNSESST